MNENERSTEALILEKRRADEVLNRLVDRRYRLRLELEEVGDEIAHAAVYANLLDRELQIKLRDEGVSTDTLLQ